MRTLAAGLLTALSATAALGQAPRVAPPAQADLDRVGLTVAWTSAVPVDGPTDGIALTQVADDKQIFIQTKKGRLVAFDAATGERQWIFHYDNASIVPYPVAINDRYVFAISLVKLYCIQRYTGITEFTFDLPVPPAAGPTVDETSVYIAFAGNRLGAYDLPPAITIQDPKALKLQQALDPTTAARVAALANPADIVANRYPGANRQKYIAPEKFEDRKVDLNGANQTIGSGNGSQRTPSLAAVRSLAPPFKNFDQTGKYITRTESLSTVHSLRQPYTLTDPNAGSTQRIASITALPVSLADIGRATDLRPHGVEPILRWITGAPAPLAYPPLQSRLRAWGVTATAAIHAVSKDDKRPQIDAILPSAPSAAPTQADEIAFIPLQDGNLVAVDLNGGGSRVLSIVWRANVGGQMNQRPVATTSGIYQAGDNAGVARVEMSSGEVTWRSEPKQDQLLAVNDEHTYLRDRQGRVHVYDRNRVNDVVSKRAYPVASIDLGGFTVPVTNDRTDRIYLAAETGLLVCLRDGATKYATPVTIALTPMKPVVKKAAVPPVAPPKPPMPAADKKADEEKKPDEKKP